MQTSPKTKSAFGEEEKKSSYKPTKIAELNELPVIGTLGVLLKAKKNGMIDKIRPLLEQLEKSDIRISPKLIDLILTAAEEND